MRQCLTRELWKQTAGWLLLIVWLNRCSKHRSAPSTMMVSCCHWPSISVIESSQNPRLITKRSVNPISGCPMLYQCEGSTFVPMEMVGLRAGRCCLLSRMDFHLPLRWQRGGLWYRAVCVHAFLLVALVLSWGI